MKRGPTVPPAIRQAAVGSRRAPGGPVGTPQGPIWIRISIVHRYGTVERSVEIRCVLSCQISVAVIQQMKVAISYLKVRSNTQNSLVALRLVCAGLQRF